MTSLLHTARYVLLGVVSAFLLLAPAQAEELPPIPIGFIGSLTSLPAFLERGQNAARMAVEEFNEAGGLNGRKLELLIRDDRGSPQEALDIAAWFVEHKKVPLLLSGSMTHISLAITAYTDRQKVPVFTAFCNSPRCDTPENRDWRFILHEHPADSAYMLAVEAAKRPVKRWGLAGSAIEWSQVQRELFTKYLKRLRPDVEIVEDQTAPLGKANGASIVEALKWKKAEGVFMTLSGSDLTDYARQARTRGFLKGVHYIAAYLPPEDLLKMKNLPLDGWFGLGFPEDGLTDPAYVAFRTAYEKKYNQNPGLSGFLHYINTKLALAALAKAGGPDRAKIREAARGLSIATPVGPVAIDPETHRVNLANWFGTFRVMKDGSVRLTDTTRRTQSPPPETP